MATKPISSFRRLWLKVKAGLPSEADLSRHRWLRPVAHRLSAPDLWRMRPESLARGLAVGIFWAFTIPLGQVIAAVAHCVWWRGNIPVAAAATLITNPLTLGGWLWLAFHTGSLFITAPPPLNLAEGASTLEWLQSMGMPTLLGMAIFAVGGSVAGYGLVRLLSAASLAHRLRKRSRRRARHAKRL